MIRTNRREQAALRESNVEGVMTRSRVRKRRGRVYVPTEISQPAQEHFGVSGYFQYKHAISVVMACLLLIVALPVMLVTGLAVAIFSPGPIFYRQRRLGQYGEEFIILKFRTMRVDAESQCGPVWSQRGDTRVTRIGRILRATHLDELPQLFNILAGDMDLVGPRPERPEWVRRLVDQVDDYEARLLVRPGITGLAQVQLPPDETLDSVRQKVRVDLEYIRSATLRLDLQILATTVAKVLGFGKPAARALFG